MLLNSRFRALKLSPMILLPVAISSSMRLITYLLLMVPSISVFDQFFTTLKRMVAAAVVFG